ncbi:uncharacterized protein LOC142584694 isoform X2 [Dermacentor variabilis]|uniref:uncharacterized protein LOC142584694 isoform X2 n=1 Tax=Dermacentor variabilis TaxID=34621 RepID=UPI003F5C91DA
MRSSCALAAPASAHSARKNVLIVVLSRAVVHRNSTLRWTDCWYSRCGVNGHEGALASEETEASLHHKGDCGTMQPEQHDKASDPPALTRCGWACRKSVWLGLQKSCKQTAVLLISADLHVRVGPTTSRHHGAFTRGIRALCVKNTEHCGYRGKEAEGPEQAPGHHASGCKIKMVCVNCVP